MPGTKASGSDAVLQTAMAGHDRIGYFYRAANGFSGASFHAAPRPGHGIVSYRASARIIADAFDAIIAVGVLVLPEVMVGITDASTTRRPSMP